MNKRLLKRHKRQVSRAKERVNLSEPDVRTPEQLKAAREASRPAGRPAQRPPRTLLHAVIRNRAGPGSNRRGESGRLASCSAPLYETVLHTLPALQIDRVPRGRRSELHGGSFPLAPSSLPLLSLWSPLFPASVARSNRGDRLRRFIAGEANRSQEGGDGEVCEKSLEMKHFRVPFVPGGGRGGPCMGRPGRWGSEDEKNGFHRGPRA